MNRQQNALAALHNGTVIPATPLALNSNRKLDEKRQRALMRYYLAAGSGGIATAVHTTQFEIRNPIFDLYQPVLEIVAEEIERFEADAGKVIVRVAGVCGPVGQAIKEAETAKQLRYDAVLLSPGGLKNFSEAQLLERTKRVAEVMPVIGFSLQTAAGGRLFTYDYWKNLCEIDNVVAIKSAPFNRYQTCDLVRAAAMSSRADKIALYTGNDDNIVIDLLTKYRFVENGVIYEKCFAGGLLGQWSVWTHTVVEMFIQLKAAAALGIIPAELLTLASQVTDANSAIFDTAHDFAGCIPGIHEILRRQGLLEGTWCLNPSETLSPGQAEEIDRVCRMYPQLNDDTFVRENCKKWF